MVVRHDGIDIDADQNPDMRHLVQIWPDGEIARGPEKPDQRIEPLDVGIALENSLELSQQGLLAVVCEKTRVHGSSGESSGQSSGLAFLNLLLAQIRTAQ